jgi:hypothetical protein
VCASKLLFQEEHVEVEEQQGVEEEQQQHAKEEEEQHVLRRRRRLSLSVCRGRLRGATWLLLLLHPHGKMIGFSSGQWVISKYIIDLFSFFILYT